MSITPNGNPKLFTRTEVKASVMQAGYGQQEKGTKGQLFNDIGDKYDEGLYDIFVQAVEDVVPGFYSIMNQVNKLWNPKWTSVFYTMPDGFIVTIKPTNSKWVEFKLFGEIPIKAKVSGVEKEKQALVLFVSIIHSVDSYIAREVIKKCNFDIITIHDGYRTHPNHTHKVKQYYNEVLANINDSNLFTDILSEILNTTIPPMEGDLNSEDILKAVYSLS